MAIVNGTYIRISDVSLEGLNYINEQSEERGIAPSRMATLIIKVVCEDKLLNALFDDAKLAELVAVKRKRQRYARRRVRPRFID